MVIKEKYSYHKQVGTHCWYCDREYDNSKSLFERPGAVLYRTVDHIIPMGAGGPDAARNKIGCCNDCNKLKGGKALLYFAYTLKEFIKTRKGHQMSKLFAMMINRCWKLYNKYDNKRAIKGHTADIIKSFKINT